MLEVDSVLLAYRIEIIPYSCGPNNSTFRVIGVSSDAEKPANVVEQAIGIRLQLINRDEENLLAPKMP